VIFGRSGCDLRASEVLEWACWQEELRELRCCADSYVERQDVKTSTAHVLVLQMLAVQLTSPEFKLSAVKATPSASRWYHTYVAISVRSRSAVSGMLSMHKIGADIKASNARLTGRWPDSQCTSSLQPRRGSPRQRLCLHELLVQSRSLVPDAVTQ
jgi:hypothetical protein